MATQLLLIQDVEKLGRSGDIVSVKPGYSRYLIPRGYALRADKNALRRQEALKEARLKQAVEDKKDSEALAEKLTHIEVRTSVKTDPDGNMYGSVTVQEVINLVDEQHGIPLEKSYFLMKHPIKEIGTRQLELNLKEDVPASIKLIIEAEGMSEEAKAIEQAKKESDIIAEIPQESSEEEV